MPFWGTILPITHPFWNQHRPGDRWNCKCDLQATDEKPTEQPYYDSDKHNPQPGLDNNPGIDAKLFADSHPYIANAYPGAKQAVENAVKELENTKKEFENYDPVKWKHSYISTQNGFVVTEKKRLEEAKASKNEKEKFKKEYRMCRVAADNGHRVEFLNGTERTPGQTYDIHLDGVATDLKATGSVGNIVKHARKAYKEQGAKAVLFEIQAPTPTLFHKFGEIKRKYDLKVYFYFAEQKVLFEFI